MYFKVNKDLFMYKSVYFLVRFNGILIYGIDPNRLFWEPVMCESKRYAPFQGIIRRHRTLLRYIYADINILGYISQRYIVSLYRTPYGACMIQATWWTACRNVGQQWSEWYVRTHSKCIQIYHTYAKLSSGTPKIYPTGPLNWRGPQRLFIMNNAPLLVSYTCTIHARYIRA